MLWVDVKKSVYFILESSKLSTKINEFLVKVSEEIFGEEFPKFRHMRTEEYDTFKFSFDNDYDFFTKPRKESYYVVDVNETLLNCKLVVDGKVIYATCVGDNLRSTRVAGDIVNSALLRLKSYAHFYTSKKRKEKQRAYENYIKKCTTYYSIDKEDETEELHKCNHKWGCICGEDDPPPGFATT